MTKPPSGEFDVSLSLSLDKVNRQTRKLAVILDYKAGLPLAAIATKYRMSEAYVSRIVRAAGEGRYRHHKELIDVVIRDYIDGVPVKKIAADYEIDRKTIWAWVQRSGTPLRKGPSAPVASPQRLRVPHVITLNIDTPTLEGLRQVATANNSTFAEAIRLTLRRGLAHDPSSL